MIARADVTSSRGTMPNSLAQRTRRAPDGPQAGETLTDADVRVAVMDRRTGRPAALPRRLLDTLGAP